MFVRGPLAAHEVLSAPILSPYYAGVLLLDDNDQLPTVPDEVETKAATQLGADGLRAIDDALGKCAQRRWLKVARVVADALRAGGFPVSDDAYVCLHARRVISLVDSGVLEAKGDLRRPRWSEVRRPAGGDGVDGSPGSSDAAAGSGG